MRDHDGIKLRFNKTCQKSKLLNGCINDQSILSSITEQSFNLQSSQDNDDASLNESISSKFIRETRSKRKVTFSNLQIIKQQTMNYHKAQIHQINKRIHLIKNLNVQKIYLTEPVGGTL